MSTHPLIGDTDDPGVAADHQEDEAEQRHVPSANHKHEHVVRTLQMSNIKRSFLWFLSAMGVFLWTPLSAVSGGGAGGLEDHLG